MSRSSELAASLALRAIVRRADKDGWVTVHEIAPDVWSGARFPVPLTEGTLDLLHHRALVERGQYSGAPWALWRLTEAGRALARSEVGENSAVQPPRRG